MDRNRGRARHQVPGGAAVAAVALLAAALLMTGCAWFGGGGGRAAGPEHEEVRLGDFYFEPAELEVQSGQEVTLRLRNVGATIHNFRIDEFQVDQDVEAGRDATITFTPDQAGTFRIICDIPGHVEAGMVGTLRVRP